MKTRDRIIMAALELFNERGESNVTTNHIAAHLGISLAISIIIFVIKKRLYTVFLMNTPVICVPAFNHNLSLMPQLRVYCSILMLSSC